MTQKRKNELRLQASYELSQKVNLLLDVFRDKQGEVLEFNAIKAGVEKHGVVLSRTRWHHIKTGDSTVEQPKEILVALAQFFDVPSEYLTEQGGELPERVNAELELVRSMRRARVKEFATRSLSEIDSETLEAISELLDENGDKKTSSS